MLKWVQAGWNYQCDRCGGK